MIEELAPFVESTSNEVEVMKIVTLQFIQGTDDCVGKPKLFSHVILNYVFKTLGITQFLTL